MSEKTIAILVPETHWDREWFETFQQFRMRLVRLTDKLMDILESDPEYLSFTFDGQTIVLEDYLEIRPHQRQRLTDLIKQERILIGPWYILPDEYLVSGEATIRNLMIGHNIARQFHRPMKAGYIPDPFGHIPQLPQILQGFGISSFIFWRGMDEGFEDLNSEFWWKGLDGTAVLAVNQVMGYCNMSGWGYRNENGQEVCDLKWAFDTAEWMAEKLEAKASTKYVLFNNGCDHREPQPELAEMIQHTNSKSQKLQIIHSTYEDFVKRILEESPDLKTLQGELHSGKYVAILPGVFSTRMYLKQENARTQTLLERYAEPTSAMRWMMDCVYESDFLWHAWKLLIQNHPHDSICGCSIDQVHREMVPRFQQSQQIAERLMQWNLSAIADKADTTTRDEKAEPVFVYNPLAHSVNELVKVRIKRPSGSYVVPPSFTVTDSGGNPVPSQVTTMAVETYHASRHDWEGEITFLTKDLPALGYCTYFITEGSCQTSSDLSATNNTLENDLIRVQVSPNGTFDLEDKRTGRTLKDLNLLENVEDAGDEYTYSPALLGSKLTSEGSTGTVSLLTSGPALGTIRVETSLRIPACLQPDRLRRSDETVDLPVTVDISLKPGSPRVDISLTVDNLADDHRLRVLFPTGVSAEQHYAETQFGVLDRDTAIPKVEGWAEPPVGTNAQQTFAGVEDDKGGLCVINMGLPEYEVIRTHDSVIALTLLRCVGWLSRNDLLSRPIEAGPILQTPEAQCRGVHTFHYAVLPYADTWKDAVVWREAHVFNAPPSASIVSQHLGDLPSRHQMLQASPESVVVSTVKKSERDDCLIIRAYNTSPDEIVAKLSLFTEVRRAKFANMDEELLEESPDVDGSVVSFPLPAFRIRTVAVWI